MEGAGRMRLRSEDSGYRALYVYFFISYIARSFPALAPKLYAEKGMAEGLIGVMTSVPSLVAMAFMPLLGSLADRAPRKRPRVRHGRREHPQLEAHDRRRPRK